VADLWVHVCGVCVWFLCVSLSWDKEGPGSGPGTPNTPFCPRALPSDIDGYEVEVEQEKLARSPSDDLIEGASVNARGSRDDEQGGIEASSADMHYFLPTCITCC
jgi:hypothetical protein